MKPRKHWYWDTKIKDWECTHRENFNHYASYAIPFIVTASVTYLGLSKINPSTELYPQVIKGYTALCSAFAFPIFCDIGGVLSRVSINQLRATEGKLKQAELERQKSLEHILA